ncbi:hypothetical protein Tco_0090421 [Tanacetum coccineum]
MLVCYATIKVTIYQYSLVLPSGSVKNKPVGHKLKLNLKAAKEATKKTVDLKPNPKTPDKPKSKEVDSVKSE